MTTKRETQGAGKPRGQKLSARTIAIRAKQARAAELRSAGYSFQRIAEELQYTNAGAAFKAVESAVGRVESESVEVLRARHDEQVRPAVALIVAVIGNEELDLELRLKAVDRLVRVQERQSRLHGLDAPVRSEVSGDGTISVSFHSALQPTIVEQDTRQIDR